MMTTRTIRSTRRGYVLFAVLIVVVVLSLAAYRYSDAMSTEFQVAIRHRDSAAAKANAISGVHYAMGMLADPNTLYGQLAGNPYDNPNEFSGVQVGEDGRFSLINLTDVGGAGESRYPRRYGVSDESSKLNINALILLDSTGEVLYNALMKLPNMTEAIADAIVDWVDPDDTTRPSGAESGYYSGMASPYRCKNGPINSIDELLLVSGVTPDLLYGNDRNRNGILDPGEDDGAEFNRGWCEYLTCYGRQLNTDSSGVSRINLNSNDLATLSEDLTSLLGQELSDYIISYRAKNTGQTYAPLKTGQVAATTEDLRSLVDAIIMSGARPARKLSSVVTIYNTQIQLPARMIKGPPGTPNTITPIVTCPLNDPAVLKELLPKLLEFTTTTTSYEMTPRVNVNTAPAEVLSALPGLTAEDVASIVEAREGLTPSDPVTLSGAWVVTVANIDPTKFRNIERYISGRSTTFRIHSVGYFGEGRGNAVARVEAVVDVSQSLPRILYFRDLTDLGRGFTDLPK